MAQRQKRRSRAAGTPGSAPRPLPCGGSGALPRYRTLAISRRSRRASFP